MCDDLQNCKVAKEEELQDPHEVNVFTMSSVAQIGDKNEQLVIIHIPTCQKKKEVMQKAGMICFDVSLNVVYFISVLCLF